MYRHDMHGPPHGGQRFIGGFGYPLLGGFLGGVLGGALVSGPGFGGGFGPRPRPFYGGYGPGFGGYGPGVRPGFGYGPGFGGGFYR
ncbi:hypothetical protein ACWE42_22135 [Sutcliffiella cohnii]